MKRKGIRLISLLFLLIFAGSSFVLGRRLLEYRENQLACGEAAELARLAEALPPAPSAAADPLPGAGAEALAAPGEGAPEDPCVQALEAIDLAGLQAVNPQVLGWILIPGTSISYPYLQGEDNTYYLNHTWKKTYNSGGAIFMECQNDPGFGGFHTILYGHRMDNTSMFGELGSYSQQAFWEANPHVYLSDGQGCRRYQIFAALEADIRSPVFQLDFSTPEQRQALIAYGLSQSVLDTQITPGETDSLLTLSTCTNRGHSTRWVVMAVLR